MATACFLAFFRIVDLRVLPRESNSASAIGSSCFVCIYVCNCCNGLCGTMPHTGCHGGTARAKPWDFTSHDEKARTSKYITAISICFHKQIWPKLCNVLKTTKQKNV